MLSASPASLTPTMTLTDLLDAYTASVACGPRYQDSLRRTVRKATGYGLATVCQLTPDRVNEFLGKLDLAAVTRSNIRRELLTLWRWGFEERLFDSQPVRVKRITPARKPPQAWSVPQLTRLLDAAERDETPVSARHPLVKRRHVLTAWIPIGYETGLRLTDVLSLRQENFRQDCIVTVAHKTNKPTVRRLGAYATKRVEWLLDHSPDDTVFGWLLPRRRAIILWRDFLKQNNTPGSSKWLRRTGATELERLHPGMAAQWLDHSNPALCKLHYIDPTLLAPPLGPPPLK
jgi:integrase